MNITTATASATLGVDLKTLDNILSREGKHLIRAGKQGRRRRIDAGTLEPIAIAIVLQRELGVPLARGLQLSGQIAADPSGQLAIGRLGTLSIDVRALRSHLKLALADVLEQTDIPTRGRPRRTSARDA
jgi:hypothetical protein